MSEKWSVEELLILYNCTNNQRLKDQCIIRCQKSILKFTKKMIDNWTDKTENEFNDILESVLLIFNKYDIPYDILLDTRQKITNVYNEKVITFTQTI